MHVLHRSSLIYLWWNNYVIIRPFCHIIVVCFLWIWHSGSKLGWYRPDAGSHRADASVFLTHNAIHIQSGEGAYRRGNSLDDSRLWSAAVEPDGRACAEWTINPTVPVCIVDQTGVQCYKQPHSDNNEQWQGALCMVAVLQGSQPNPQRNWKLKKCML